MEIDLNLLRVFDLLYEERNMTRAAARLFLTQSAVSHALARLRIVLDDPLFLRIPSGLQPTQRAHQLAPRLRVALAEIRNLVAAPVFDPATTSRRFTISASSYFCGLITRVTTLVRRSAPGVSLQFVNLGANLTQAVDQQQVDVVLGGFGRIPIRFRSEFLFQDELAWVTGVHHAAGEQPSTMRPFSHGPASASLPIRQATDTARARPMTISCVMRPRTLVMAPPHPRRPNADPHRWSYMTWLRRWRSPPPPIWWRSFHGDTPKPAQARHE